MNVSVIIPTLGRETLGDCVKSLEEQTYKDFELLLVSPEKIKIETELEDFRRIHSNNNSLSEDRNLGIKKSRGDVVIFIDDDAIADETWLENIVKHYNDEEVSCVGGKIKPLYCSEVPEDIAGLDEHIRKGIIGATFIKWEKAGEIKSPLLWGCNISFRKKVFEETGFFPKELGRKSGELLGDEERYMQLKLLDRNKKIVYEPQAKVEHIIEEEQLTERYFIEKSFKQGISEIKRLSLSEGKIFRTPEEIVTEITKYKLLEERLKFYSLHDLKEKIDTARKIGRLCALRRLDRN